MTTTVKITGDRTVYALPDPNGTGTYLYIQTAEDPILFGPPPHTWTWWCADSIIPTFVHGARDGWLHHDGPPQDLLATITRPGPPLGYRICDPGFVSKRTPAQMTVQEFDDSGFEDTDVGKLYEPVFGPESTETVRYTLGDADGAHGTVKVLDRAGKPEPASHPRWNPTLPGAFLHDPSLHHLFPGTLTGFREAARRHAETWLRDHGSVPDTIGSLPPGRAGFTSSSSSTLTVMRRIQLPDGFRELKVSIDVPDHIAGGDLFEAMAWWDARLNQYSQVMERSLLVEACETCVGVGVVPARSGGPEAWISRLTILVNERLNDVDGFYGFSVNDISNMVRLARITTATSR